MDLRGLLNTAYAALAHGRDADELRILDGELAGERVDRSRNVHALMAFMPGAAEALRQGAR